MTIGGWYDGLIYDAVVYVIIICGVVILVELVGLFIIYLLSRRRK